jgi:glycosyltransferase involved in cell wall biosynthesis
MAIDKISVIIPVFNPGPVLSKAIESIVTQDYNDIELVIIDGGSTDGTLDLLKKFNTSIHYWISEPDDGIYNAMNKGIAAASGTWLLFLGADDELCPGVIASIFNSADFTNTDLIYGKVIIKNERKLLGLQTDFEKLIALNIPHQAIFYRKSIFEKFKGYNQQYKILADYDLNLKIFEDSSLQKKFVTNTVSSFCNNGISNRTIDYKFFSEKKDYFIKQQKLLKTDKRIAKYYFYSGVALVLKKNFRTGSANIFHAIIFSQNRFYYLMLTLDFILSMLGIRKKYKYV